MAYREKSLQNLAHRLGYQYSEGDAFGLSTKLQGFRLTSQGHDHEISNVLRSRHELLEHDLFVFDYRFDPYTGRGDTHQTVLFVQSQQMGLPELHLQPETLVHKFGELLGWGDIDFVRFPKFSGQYRLTGDDEVFIRHHFNEDVLNFFTLNKGWSLEGIGYYLILYKKGLLLPPDQIQTLFRNGMQVYGLFRQDAPTN